MFRVYSRLVPRRTLLVSASAAAAGIVLTDSAEEKLSIYPDKTVDILLVKAPSPLEEYIGLVRRKIAQGYHEATGHVQGVVSRWIDIEHAIENRTKAIISPNEQLTPGLLYVGVATLTGSILARNRMLGARLLVPPLFFFVSAKHFLPQTTSNLTSHFGSLEDTYLPTLAQKHDVANAHSRIAWEQFKEAVQNGQNWVNRNSEVAIEKVQEVTGLKVKETFSSGKHKVEAKAVEVAKLTEAKVVEVKTVVDKGVDKLVEESKK